MYNGGNTDGYGGGIQSHGGSRYSPYGNNATPNHLQAKDMVSFSRAPNVLRTVFSVHRTLVILKLSVRNWIGFKGLKVC